MSAKFCRKKVFGILWSTDNIFLDVVAFNVAIEPEEDLLGFVEFPLSGEPPRTFWEEEKNYQHDANHTPLSKMSLWSPLGFRFLPECRSQHGSRMDHLH